MFKKGKIDKLMARLSKRYQSETKIVVLNEGAIVQNPDPDVLYVKIVPALSVNSLEQ